MLNTVAVFLLESPVELVSKKLRKSCSNQCNEQQGDTMLLLLNSDLGIQSGGGDDQPQLTPLLHDLHTHNTGAPHKEHSPPSIPTCTGVLCTCMYLFQEANNDVGIQRSFVSFIQHYYTACVCVCAGMCA